MTRSTDALSEVVDTCEAKSGETPICSRPAAYVHRYVSGDVVLCEKHKCITCEPWRTAVHRIRTEETR